MTRYVAFLRGVSPLNARMAELKRCFEQAGFENVRTVLTSGNVAFDARTSSESNLEKRIEKAMRASLDRVFTTIVRKSAALRALQEQDPYSAHKVSRSEKRVVIFLRTARRPKVALPLDADGARILGKAGKEAFAVYVAGSKGPALMRLAEKAFGTDITTRTWETVAKAAAA